MGNSSRKGGCSSVASCCGSGTSASAQNAVPSPSPEAGSPSTPMSQQNQSTSTQASVADLVSKLQGYPKDVTRFKEILAFIDQALEKHRSHSSFDVRIPERLKGNLDDADAALKRIYDLCKEKAGNEIQIEFQMILSDAFGRLGTVHWITAAFSLVAFLLKRIENTQEVKENCLDILEKVRKLGHQVADLFEVIPDQNDKLWEAGSSVVEAAVFCIQELDSSYFRRFTFVNVRLGDISKIKEQISHLYQDLTLTVSKESLAMGKENLKREAQPLQSYKPDDPHAVGRSDIIEDILGVMQRVPSQHQAILLHGLGGIGKTTIARKVVARLDGKFKAIAQVEIGANPSSKVICDCQKMILERLFGSKQEIGDDSEGRRLLRDKFKTCSTPILLFVDNIFQQINLENLLPEDLFSVLPDNSYLLVTSRYARVSDAFSISGVKWKEFSIEPLKDADAEVLFEGYLDGYPEDKREQFHRLLAICGGWPLAIQVVGSYLRRYKGDDVTWDSTVTKLLQCNSVSSDSQDRLERILDWSYSQLDGAAQNVFLDMSCLLGNADWSWLAALGTGSELKALEARSLVKRAGEYGRGIRFDGHGLPLGVQNEFAEVHDLVVAMGQQKEGEESSGRARRIRAGSETLPTILGDDDQEAGCEDIQGLYADRKVTISAKKLDAMSKTIRILRLLPRGRFKGECGKIPKKLQICSTYGFPYKGLTGLDDLRVLNIVGESPSARIKFDCEILPKTLRVLDLTEIRSLERFHEDAFRNCSSLHTVRIKDCDKLSDLPANFGHIRSMRLLQLNLRKLRNLPSGLNGMDRLEDFECDRSPLEEFPSIVAGMKNLRSLVIGGFKSLPKSVDLSQLSQLKILRVDFGGIQTDMVSEQPLRGFGELCALQCLRIENWVSLTRLADDFSKLTALKELSFQCYSLTQLPEGFENLHALAELHLSGCCSLEYLPDSISQLSSLVSLHLRECTSLIKLPEGVHRLLALSELDLGGCSGLQSLPDVIFQLSALEKLCLDGCASLSEFPRGFGNLLRLSELRMRKMDNLEQVPDGLLQLSSLRQLEIPARFMGSGAVSTRRSLENLARTDCKATETHMGFENFISLTELTLHECESMTDLPSGFGSLLRLQDLKLNNCKSLRGLPDEVGNLLDLRRVDISGSEALRYLPDSICRLKSLQSLTLEGNFQKLPENLGDLSALGDLKLVQCQKLRELPDGIGSLLGLVILELHDCVDLQHVPASIVRLKRLVVLSLGGCYETLPEIFTDLSHLSFLSLTCRNLRELPEGVGSLLGLIGLDLRGCEDLQQLPDSIFRLKKLRHLQLAGCFERLPTTFGHLSLLSDLDLSGCRKIRELPHDIGSLRKITCLNLEGCEDLQQLPDSVCSLKNIGLLMLGGAFERLPDNFGDLSTLERLHLSRCRKLDSLPESMLQLTKLTFLQLPTDSELGQMELVRQLENQNGFSVTYGDV